MVRAIFETLKMPVAVVSVLAAVMLAITHQQCLPLFPVLAMAADPRYAALSPGEILKIDLPALISA